MHIKKLPRALWRFMFTFVFAVLPLPLASIITPVSASPDFDIAASPKTIHVVLSEWAIDMDTKSIQAGPVSFSVKNEGPVDRHEFVVFKTDLGPDALPADSEGVDEKGVGITLIGEIEGIRVGAAQKTISFELAPGNYVLVCNIWDASEQESHYHEDMRVKFTVTESGKEIS